MGNESETGIETVATIKGARDLGTVILRDGIAVAVERDGYALGGVLGWFHRHHSFSMDHAIEHEGYSILEDRIDDTPEGRSVHNDARGWAAFVGIRDGLRGRGGLGYGGMDVLAVELIVRVAELAEENGGAFRDDYIVSGDVVEPMLRAALTALNYTSGHLALINGKLDGAIRELAGRFGIDGDAL